MSEDKLFVVAIDFGTTYSGYGFSHIHEKDHIYTYNWTARIGMAPKTPTSILFNSSGMFDSFGYEAEIKYAYLSQRKENKDWYFFKRFKLSLYKNKWNLKDLNESTKISDYTGKPLPALKVFSAGIKFLKDHLFSHFQQRIGILRETDIHWVLTVPAIWDETAKKFMRKAAEEAGINGNQLTLALEPESAALYCLSSQSGLQPKEIGDKFLLLDCGGGTVDVTVHELRMDKSLKEIFKASGGPWGGIKVDDAFQEYLIEVFGLEKILDLPKNDVVELDKSFESLKKKIGCEERLYMQIPMSLRCVAPIGLLIADRLKIPLEKAKTFFAKPVKNICEHLQEILSSYQLRGVRTILLVGGFAESKLLQNEIKRTFPLMNIYTPNEPSSAVVKGAVMFGHSPEKISHRISPFTYGIDSAIPFRHAVHPVEKLIKVNGEEYCADIFDKHVTINQLVETGKEISNQTYRPLNKEQRSILFEVVSSEKENPRFVTDAGCKTIGSFRIELPRYVMFDSEISINVKMIFSGTELIVEARDNITKQLCKNSFRFE